MVAENQESYNTAISTMPRTQLEKFALQAANAMEELERENAQLKQDIDDVQKIDIKVIDGWRQWSQTVDEEREKWADTATRLSTEKQEIKEEYENAVETIENILEYLGDIESVAIEHSKEGSKVLLLRTGYKKLLKMIKEVVDKYAVVEEESEAETSAEDSADAES